MASWLSLGGYRATLEQMGHEVIDCSLPGNHPGVKLPQIGILRQRMPTINQLNECDAIISFFHEYTQLWLEDLYETEWHEKRTAPVIARFDESMDRLDAGIPLPMGLTKGATSAQRVAELKRWADAFSFPAAQDAEKYGGQWLPFGADVNMFKPDDPLEPTRKEYEMGFIGSMYDIRQTYMEKLSPFLEGVTFSYTPQGWPVVVMDISGIRTRETTELLAKNYRQIKLFFCLPPRSHLLVCKLFEVMACGTFVMYPRMHVGGSDKNNVIFENNKHLAYYDPGYLKANAAQVRHFLEHDDEREEIARAGCELVHEKYRLDQMLDRLLSLVRKPAEAKD